MEYYFKRYGDLELQRRMVSDRPRTDAFAEAIRRVVSDGDRVLDVGTGTGLLAMLAARAGARSVFGIDQADIAKTAANLVKANGLQDQVRILQGPAADLHLDEKVDLLVSEWLGHVAYVEGMLDDVLVARDHNLKPGGKMMPERVRVLIALLDDPILYGSEGPGFWRETVRGLDYSSLEEAELAQGRSLQIRVEPAALLSPPGLVNELDLATCGPKDMWGTTRLQMTVLRDGVLNGFAAWFEADLGGGVLLDTGPRATETHWSQTYFSFWPTIVKAGQVITLDCSLGPDAEEARYVAMNIDALGRSQRFAIE